MAESMVCLAQWNLVHSCFTPYEKAEQWYSALSYMSLWSLIYNARVIYTVILHIYTLCNIHRNKQPAKAESVAPFKHSLNLLWFGESTLPKRS